MADIRISGEKHLKKARDLTRQNRRRSDRNSIAMLAGLATKFFTDKYLSRDNYTKWTTGDGSIDRNAALRRRKNVARQVNDAFALQENAEAANQTIREYLYDTEGNELRTKALASLGEGVDINERAANQLIDERLNQWYQNKEDNATSIINSATEYKYNPNISDKDLEKYIRMNFDSLNAPSLKKGFINIFESLGGGKNREERLNTAITNSVYQQNDIKMEKDFKKLKSLGYDSMSALEYILQDKEDFMLDTQKTTTVTRKVENDKVLFIRKETTTDLGTGDSEGRVVATLSEDDVGSEGAFINYWNKTTKPIESMRNLLTPEAFNNFKKSIMFSTGKAGKMGAFRLPQTIAEAQAWDELIVKFAGNSKNHNADEKFRRDFAKGVAIGLVATNSALFKDVVEALHAGQSNEAMNLLLAHGQSINEFASTNAYQPTGIVPLKIQKIK